MFLGASLWNLFYGLVAGESFTALLRDSRIWLVAAVGLIFLVSLKITSLRRVQPLLFLGCSIIPYMELSAGLYGFGLFTVGVVLLFLDGFFSTRRILKPVLLFVFLIAVIVVSAIVGGGNIKGAVSVIFFIMVFFAFLLIAFQQRVIVYLKADKPLLSLTAKGLHPMERAYTLTLLKGKSLKEIAFKYQVSESTVRNALSRTYRKLGIRDKSELLVLAEKYQIKD